MDKLSLIRTFLEERLGIDPGAVTPEATLQGLDVDSLMLMELLFEFEEKLGVTLSQGMATPKTIRDLIAIVERMEAAQAAN